MEAQHCNRREDSDSDLDDPVQNQEGLDDPVDQDRNHRVEIEVGSWEEILVEEKAVPEASWEEGRLVG